MVFVFGIASRPSFSVIFSSDCCDVQEYGHRSHLVVFDRDQGKGTHLSHNISYADIRVCRCYCSHNTRHATHGVYPSMSKNLVLVLDADLSSSSSWWRLALFLMLVCLVRVRNWSFFLSGSRPVLDGRGAASDADTAVYSPHTC